MVQTQSLLFFYKLDMGFLDSRLADHKVAPSWAAVEERHDPRLADHPMKGNPAWRSTYIPMALHGDAEPVVKVGKAASKSLNITSVSPLMAIETHIIKQCIYAVRESS